MSFFNLACRSSSFGDDDDVVETINKKGNDARRRWKQQGQVHGVFFKCMTNIIILLFI